jgi:K+-transporting ATPase A subunit
MDRRYAVRLVVGSLAFAAAGGVGPVAHASAMGHFGGNGNGKFNHNSISINSPTNIKGIQNVSNTVVSGSSPTQAALCKKRFHHCRIVQRLIVDP